MTVSVAVRQSRPRVTAAAPAQKQTLRFTTVARFLLMHAFVSGMIHHALLPQSTWHQWFLVLCATAALVAARQAPHPRYWAAPWVPHCHGSPAASKLVETSQQQPTLAGLVAACMQLLVSFPCAVPFACLLYFARFREGGATQQLRRACSAKHTALEFQIQSTQGSSRDRLGAASTPRGRPGHATRPVVVRQRAFGGPVVTRFQ